MDLYSRRIVGWATSAINNKMDRELVLSALAMAVNRRAPSAGLLRHSDQGSQYAGWDCQREMRQLGITCSMGRRGN